RGMRRAHVPLRSDPHAGWQAASDGGAAPGRCGDERSSAGARVCRGGDDARDHPRRRRPALQGASVSLFNPRAVGSGGRTVRLSRDTPMGRRVRRRVFIGKRPRLVCSRALGFQPGCCGRIRRLVHRLARTLMLQGTASSVGKSLLTAAMCRLFRREGLRVAPFKAQNMALNAAVTPSGGEIGRAQAVQAEAAGIEPTIELNPILLKPEGGMRSQVVILGRSAGSMTWSEYQAMRSQLIGIVDDCIARLRRDFDLVVIEGAGSPAEINLTGQDLVNMHVARAADAPVLLIGDIDRGGVFAHLAGTFELLAPPDRARIAGFVINKFRGDRDLLKPGLDFLEARCGVPVLGVVPYIQRLRIAEEDSVALEDRSRSILPSSSAVRIAIVRLPRISNYDDFS